MIRIPLLKVVCFVPILFCACPKPVATVDGGSTQDVVASDVVADQDADDAQNLSDAGVADANAADANAADANAADANAADASAPNAGPDVVPLDDLGPVQCRESSDCSEEQQQCNRAAPGGICLGCGTSCVSGTECQFGACIRTCDDDDDCHVAFECLSSARCALRSCENDDDCPGPYVCGEASTCERPRCEAGACPSPLTCESDRCVETE